MTKTPETILHRVAQGPSPWVPYKGTKFKGRYDDPKKEYYVLYACTDRVGCFMECLAYFRESTTPEWDKLVKFDSDDTIPPAEVPIAWVHNRSSQSAMLHGIFADVAHAYWIARFRDYHWWIDQSSIYNKEFREETQWISRMVHDDQTARYAGIFYLSRHGANFSNWAAFEDWLSISWYGPVSPVSPTDPDLLTACNLLRIAPPVRTSATAR